MKLPWDRNYIKISFHVVVTLLFIGVSVIILSSLPQVFNAMGIFLSICLSMAAPLICAIVIAFLFNPVVGMFENKIDLIFKRKKRKNRLFGTILTYITIILVITFAITMTINKLGVTDINKAAYAINIYIQELSDMLLDFQRRISRMGILSTLNEVINGTIINMTRAMKTGVWNVSQGLASVGSIALNLGIGFVVAFYFLMEKDPILNKLRRISSAFLPPKANKSVCTFFHNANEVFSGYVTGQITDAIIMATLIIVCFSLAGIKYAVFIGIISGFSNLIPYIGAIVAFILSIMVGLISDDPIKALYAAIIVIVLQQIDSMIIVPKIVGKNVKLHPVLVILALSFFGSLFGLWGMVLAVPITALFKLYFDKAVVHMEEHRGRLGRLGKY